MLPDDEFRRWKRDRDKAIASMDVGAFRRFYFKWSERGLYTAPLPPDNVIEVALRKMAVSIPSLPAKLRTDAEVWLITRGCDLEMT
jgi:hypothetical protein